MTLLPGRRFAGVLAHHQGDVVLVREGHDRWGGEFWNIPSGIIEVHESPAAGAARELAEETGLVVSSRRLRLRTTSSVVLDGTLLRSWNFEVEVDDPSVKVADPDLLVQEARWFPVDQAVERLRPLPYRPLVEPAVATLTGDVTGPAHWEFPSLEAEPVVTLRECVRE